MSSCTTRVRPTNSKSSCASVSAPVSSSELERQVIDSPIDTAVLSITQIHAGDAYNVIPDEASLPVILESHVVTTGALLDAMVAHDVPRIVYASPNHAVGRRLERNRLG